MCIVSRSSGTTYSLVDAERDPASICEAIAAGRVRVATRPLSWWTAIRIMLSLFAAVGRVPANLSPAVFEDEFVTSTHLRPVP